MYKSLITSKCNLLDPKNLKSEKTTSSPRKKTSGQAELDSESRQSAGTAYKPLI